MSTRSNKDNEITTNTRHTNVTSTKADETLSTTAKVAGELVWRQTRIRKQTPEKNPEFIP